MSINKKKLTIQILTVIGFLLTIKLACIYYVANYEKYALSSFCSINDFIDCDGAAKSSVSQFWGIPLAYWGMLFYITVFFLTIVDKLKQVKFLKFLEVFKNPLSYIATLGTIAFACSMVLAGLSLFKIHKLCILCVITYFMNLLIALVASHGKLKDNIKRVATAVVNSVKGPKKYPRIIAVLIFALFFYPKALIVLLIFVPFLFTYSEFKITFIDFIDGAKKYPKTFVVLLVLAISFFTYSGVTYNFVPHIKKQKAILKYRKIKFNPYRVKGNTLGSEKADVVIELYSDYVCPLCYIHNIMLHQAAKEFSNIKIIHHNYPFDKECNPYISFNMHPNACFMARGAIAARNQGNYWEMSSLLYENQPTKMEDMLKLAKQLNFNEAEFISDFESDKTSKEIEAELNKAVDLNIDSTPTMYVNGDKIVGVKPYYELKEILIKHGAKRK